MALVRCKSCGIDTSDSLERCPNCGGSPSGVGLASLVAAATEAASQAAAGADKADAAAPSLRTPPPQWSRIPRAAWIVGALVVLAVVPHAFPALVVAAILWLFSRARQASQSTSRTLQGEVLKVFKNEASSARRAGSARPLERLRTIERATLKRDA